MNRNKKHPGINMNKKLPILHKKDDIITSKAEQAVLSVLPVDQKTLQKTMKFLEPKNLKRIALAVVGGSALVSIVTSIGHDRIYRAAVSHEVKKQLDPVMKKLNELEAQNTALYRQNKELTKLLMKNEEAKIKK